MKEINEKEVDFEKKHNKIIDFIDNLSDNTDNGVAKDNNIDIMDKIKLDTSDNQMPLAKGNAKSSDKDKNIKGRMYSFSKSKSGSKKKFLPIILILSIIFIIAAIIVLQNDINDSDGDGIPDDKDLFPNKNAKIKFSVIGLHYLDWENLTGYTTFYYRIGELIDFDWDEFTYEYRTNNATGYRTDKLNYNTFIFDNVTIDVADDIASHTITVQFFMFENEITTFLDIDDDDTGGLTLQYNIVTGEWTGDDSTGTSDGSLDDGIITNTDCYLKYRFETI